VKAKHFTCRVRTRVGRERTTLKLEHIRKSGRKFGRPAKLNADQAAFARRMKDNGEAAEIICRTLGIGRTTLDRYLADSDEES
jgi:DNA invertase Pin-like site-specific DNA recombinase